MTLKELFKKVETYNEIAEMMNTRKAKINFYTRDPKYSIRFGESFDSYKSLQKYVRKEYCKEMADAVLKFSGYELDKEVEIEFTDYFGTQMNVFGTDLVAD